MRSLSNLGLTLIVIFACLFFALLAEFYYLWWKKKSSSNTETQRRHGSSETELFFICCQRRPSPISEKARNRHEQEEKKVNKPESQLRILQSKNDFLDKPLEEDDDDDIEAELMKLQGPPRFLYTIVEETKEDLEAEELILTVEETPFLTPLNSPSVFPPLTPTESCKQNGFNPFFESLSDAEFNKIRSSPPPTFKFLQDAEEKLQRKLMAEAEKITVMVDLKKDRNGFDYYHRFPQLHSNNWQVIPLDYSPQNHNQKPKTNL